MILTFGGRYLLILFLGGIFIWLICIYVDNWYVSSWLVFGPPFWLSFTFWSFQASLYSIDAVMMQLKWDFLMVALEGKGGGTRLFPAGQLAKNMWMGCIPLPCVDRKKDVFYSCWRASSCIVSYVTRWQRSVANSCGSRKMIFSFWKKTFKELMRHMYLLL